MEFNATFVVIFASFVVFMVLMRQVFFEPMRRIKAARDAEINHAVAEAEQSAEALAKLEAEQSAQLAKARQQAQQVIAQVRQEALASAQQQREQALKDSSSQLEAHADAVAKQGEALKAELASERDAFAQAIVQKLTGANHRQPAAVN